MKTYYVVTCGSYSDYHICAVTEDKERAEHLKLFFSTEYDAAQVEEYHDDIHEEEQAVTVYPWNISLRKWMPSGAESVDHAYQYRYEDTIPFQPEFDYYDHSDYRNTPYVALECQILAANKEHALKIARDELAKRYAQTVGV